MTCVANWPASPSTLALTATSENVVVTDLWVSVTHPPSGGVQLFTDFPVGTQLSAGVSKTVNITVYAGTNTPYVWQSGDLHVVRVTVHRPGQSTNFTLYLIHEQ